MPRAKLATLDNVRETGGREPDRTGRIQLYFRRDELGDDRFSVLELLDIGDVVGAEGVVIPSGAKAVRTRVESI